MYPWFYVWSPRYRIFHEVLQFGARDISGVAVKPIFIPQSYFERKVEDTSQHFFTGIGIKMYCLLKSAESLPADSHFIFSDADLILPEKDLAVKLKSYEINDITAMREKKGEDTYNIGFLLVKNTPEVRQFFWKVLQRIQKEVKLDQDIFNEEIKEFKGTHGFFDIKDFIQSSMIRKDIWDSGNYSVIQCLSSASSYKEAMLGKLATVIYYYNITPLFQYVDKQILKELREYIFHQNPNHYLCTMDMDAHFSSAEELPKNP